MRDPAALRLDALDMPAAEREEFERWCGCVRRLLGWRSGEMQDWPALFASGHTPRDAARLAVYGEGIGD